MIKSQLRIIGCDYRWIHGCKISFFMIPPFTEDRLPCKRKGFHEIVIGYFHPANWRFLPGVNIICRKHSYISSFLRITAPYASSFERNTFNVDLM